MSFTRIYQAFPLKLHTEIDLDQQASHHVAHVLRATVGDKMRVFNGESHGDYEAMITHINKKTVRVKIIYFLPSQTEPPIEICLAQGMARGEKMDVIVQKAVELGVTKIMPLVTERCQVRLDRKRIDSRLAHWRAIVISACEQSGRVRLPTIDAPLAFTEWLPTAKSDQCFVLSPHRQEKLLTPVKQKKSSIVLLIGPEGGLTDQEVDLALAQGFTPLNLGPRILRTETAAIAALTLFQFCYGDIG